MSRLRGFCMMRQSQMSVGSFGSGGGALVIDAGVDDELVEVGREGRWARLGSALLTVDHESIDMTAAD